MTDDKKKKTDTSSSDIRHPSSGAERIAKRLARAGLCSRREAERWIADGRVRVNGKKIDSPALNVSPEDAVIVDGKPLAAAEKTRLWLYHKPSGLVTTHNDPQKRPTVFDALPKDIPRVISVGRLDLNSEGLLLLTNDGELARKLELPETGWTRRYRVRAFGSFSEGMLARMQKPLTIDGVRYQAVDIKMENTSPARGGGKVGEAALPYPSRKREGFSANRWLVVSLNEGKNREIRKIFEHFDLKVNRLIRLAYGPFQLGALKSGETKEVPQRVFKSFVPRA